jgi:alcohol dehydrogenase class IV
VKQQYYMPTRVIMGKDCIKSNPEIFLEIGRKILIVTGAKSAKNNGSLDDILSVLSSNGQAWTIFDRVTPNPSIACVKEGAAFAQKEKVDSIIAIGGGSPMDAAKAINLLACQDISDENLFSGKYGTEILPMIFVPTTAGTGSEVTPYSVLTNDRAQTKTSLGSPILFPKYAFLDAKYMKDMPLDITINTAIDALSHSIEGMITKRANPITNSIAAESIRRISSCFEALKSGDLSLEQRFELLYGSTLAGMVIANTGTTAVHSMGYSLTYFHNVDHGRANGLILAAFMSYINKYDSRLITSILSIMGFKTIQEFKDTLDILLGERRALSREEVERYAAIAAKSRNASNSIVIPDMEDLVGILSEALLR